jgi:hypothetical protein
VTSGLIRQAARHSTASSAALFFVILGAAAGFGCSGSGSGGADGGSGGSPHAGGSPGADVRDDSANTGGSSNSGGAIAGTGGSSNSGGAIAGTGGSGNSGGARTTGTPTGGQEGGSGGTSGDGGTDGGGGGGGDSRLWPLEIGRVWSYRVYSQPNCSSGDHQTTVVGEGQLDGKPGYVVAYWCTPSANFTVTVEGNIVHNVAGLLLDEPVEDGHTWGYYSYTRKYSYAGTVKVIAGTFEGCWDVDTGLLGRYITFCPGVGEVRLGVSGGEVAVELLSKNF